MKPEEIVMAAVFGQIALIGLFFWWLGWLRDRDEKRKRQSRPNGRTEP